MFLKIDDCRSTPQLCPRDFNKLHSRCFLLVRSIMRFYLFGSRVDDLCRVNRVRRHREKSHVDAAIIALKRHLDIITSEKLWGDRFVPPFKWLTYIRQTLVTDHLKLGRNIFFENVTDSTSSVRTTAMTATPGGNNTRHD